MLRDMISDKLLNKIDFTENSSYPWSSIFFLFKSMFEI